MTHRMLRFEEMISEIASTTGATKKEAAKVINAYIDLIDRELQEGNDVRLKGIGRFCVRTSKSKKVINKYFGVNRTIPPKKYIHFQCSEKMLRRIN